MLRDGVAPSYVRMKKSLPSHALNNRENVSPTKLAMGSRKHSHVAHSWSCTGMQDTWRFPGRFQAHHLVPKFPDFYSRVIMLKSFMRSAEISWCFCITDVLLALSLLQLPNCCSIFTQGNADVLVVAMSWFLPHRVTILYFVFQVKLQRKRGISAELWWSTGLTLLEMGKNCEVHDRYCCFALTLWGISWFIDSVLTCVIEFPCDWKGHTLSLSSCLQKS